MWLYKWWRWWGFVVIRIIGGHEVMLGVIVMLDGCSWVGEAVLVVAVVMVVLVVVEVVVVTMVVVGGNEGA